MAAELRTEDAQLTRAADGFLSLRLCGPPPPQLGELKDLFAALWHGHDRGAVLEHLEAPANAYASGLAACCGPRAAAAAFADKTGSLHLSVLRTPAAYAAVGARYTVRFSCVPSPAPHAGHVGTASPLLVYPSSGAVWITLHATVEGAGGLLEPGDGFYFHMSLCKLGS